MKVDEHGRMVRCRHATGPFAALTTKALDFQGFRERMMGLEPTTSCMATRPEYRNLDQEPHG